MAPAPQPRGTSPALGYSLLKTFQSISEHSLTQLCQSGTLVLYFLLDSDRQCPVFSYTWPGIGSLQVQGYQAQKMA